MRAMVLQSTRQLAEVAEPLASDTVPVILAKSYTAMQGFGPEQL